MYIRDVSTQPPSGGCVLKQAQQYLLDALAVPAAFGRLCVETKPATDKYGGR